MGGGIMLVRQNYYTEKRKEIKLLILEILNDLTEMTEYYDSYLKNPTEETKKIILKNESYIDKNEKRIDKHILEIFSLEQLNTDEIKWLLTMSRIIRELERVGDQLINIITISNVVDTDILRPLIKDFFEFEKDMIKWLAEGIETNNVLKLEDVISHDQHVNNLNKETYQTIASQLNDMQNVSESKLKMIIISRFLERIGDHLVNSARLYIKTIQ